MKISPLDIYNKEFNKSTFGYNKNQVDEFLEDVGMAYEKLLKEVNQLQERNNSLQEKLTNYENIEEQMENIMLTVRDTAEQQSKQAQKKADYIIKKAELKAEKIEEKARNKIKDEYRMLEKLKENRDLFEIRFKTLLESHRKMLDEQLKEKEKELSLENFEKIEDEIKEDITHINKNDKDNKTNKSESND